MKLNLEAKTPAEQKVKAYLEQNASEVLARKINEGVKIVKDGKTLLNKKTLAGFLKYACDEAKKQAEKGAQSACIYDAVVYGWACIISRRTPSKAPSATKTERNTRHPCPSLLLFRPNMSRPNPSQSRRCPSST